MSMKITSFNDSLTFNDERVNTAVLLESSFSKEIGIAMKKGQVMKEHKTPFPIVVHLLEGKIDFGVQGSVHSIGKGEILALDGNVPHDLVALEDSIVRLTLSKLDKVERVEKVVKLS